MTLPNWNPRMLSRAARPYSPAGKARSDLPGIGEDARYNQGRSARQQIDYENDPAVQEGQAPEEGVDKSSAMRIPRGGFGDSHRGVSVERVRQP
jgi:hypothetical protein